MTQSMWRSGEVCFTTLALGLKYRQFAKLLANDLKLFAPSQSFLVLTDKPDDFAQLDNVEACKHVQESLWRPYHDKRFALREALQRYEACIFLDADVRIASPIPEDPLSTLPIGLSAYFPNRWLSWESTHPKEGHKAKMVRDVAKALEISLEDSYFVYEQAFAIRAPQEIRENTNTFFDTWTRLAHHFQLQGWHEGEGHSIGLAATHAGISVFGRRFLSPAVLFKDLDCYLEQITDADLVAHLMKDHCGIEERARKPIQDLVSKRKHSIRRRIRTVFPPSGWERIPGAAVRFER